MKILEPTSALEFIDANKENPDFILLDIRRQVDFQKNWLEGAINMPYYNEEFDDILKKMNKNKIYLVYCSSNAASNITVETMEELGFNNVQKINGGISRWHKLGLTIKSSKKVKNVI